MNRTWVHNDLTAPYGPRRMQMGPSTAVGAETVSANAIIAILTMLVGFVVASFFTGMFLHSAWTGNDRTASNSFSPPVLASVSASSYVSNLTNKQKRLMAAQIHFIATRMKPYKVSLQTGHEIARAIVEESYKTGFDPLYIAAVVFAESAFHSRAISPVGARGLMQLMPDTAQYISTKTDTPWHGTHALYSPAYNIQLGTRYLQYLSRMYDGDSDRSLIAYNWGPGNLNLSLRGKRQVPTVSRRYVAKIDKYYQKWTSEFSSNRVQYEFGALYHAIY